MLQAVAIGLLWLKDSLASTLFTEAWQKLASEINEVRVPFYKIRQKSLIKPFISSFF